MTHKNVLNSPRLLEIKREKRKVTRIKIFLVVTSLLVVFFCISIVARSSKVNINQIEVVGNKVIEIEAIKEIADEKLQGHYLWFLPKTNFLFYPKTKIKNKLASEFKRFENISLNIKNFKTLEINVAERTALYIWCGATPLGENTDIEPKCYFLDDSGYIFDEAPYFSGEVYFRFYGKDSINNLNEDNPSGHYFMKGNFEKVTAFKKILEQIGLKPVALYLVPDGDVKIFLSAPSGAKAGPQIIFKNDSDFNKLAENLQAALTTEPLKSDFKKKYASLLYLDLRFGNKVYYKFQ